jgi:hypothetical protein
LSGAADERLNALDVNRQNEQTSLTKAVQSKGQYLLAFGVIASLLIVVNVPIFIVFFFGVFAYFMARMFSAGSKMRTRAIFEFYLSAQEMLKRDDRNWYGFEINETINRGERIVKEMRSAPPLVHYALGALYNKIGDHAAAVRHLSYVAENPESFEGSVVYPSAELRSYVSVLRKIEREPSEAPLTSAAVRALSRGRKLKADTLLNESRSIVESTKVDVEHPASLNGGVGSNKDLIDQNTSIKEKSAGGEPLERPESVTSIVEENRHKKDRKNEPARKPIVEVLHEIYDRNIQ